MSYPGNRGKFIPEVVTANKTITASEIETEGLYVAVTSEIYLQIPAPNGGLGGKELRICNASDGYVAIVTANGVGFADGTGCIALAPGGIAKLDCFKSNVAGTTYYWYYEGCGDPPVLTEWTVTGTYATATPTETTKGYYSLHDGICEFEAQLTGTDGAGGSLTSINLPLLPADIDAYIACEAQVSVAAAAPSNATAVIDCLHNTAESRLCNLLTAVTLTDDAAYDIRIKGSYPVAGAKTVAWTPTVTGVGASPTVSSTVAKFYESQGKIFAYGYSVISDGKNATGVTYTPPAPVKDLNTYVVGYGVTAVDTGGTPAYTAQMPFIDATDNTCANRLISGKAYPTLTDAKACWISFAIQYEIDGGYAVTPVETWGTATPASVAHSFRYQVHPKERMVSFEYYMASTDSNACSSLTVPLPIPARYIASLKIALPGYQISNTSKTDPGAYIQADSTTLANRMKVQFANFVTGVDAQAKQIYCAGKYRY